MEEENGGNGSLKSKKFLLSLFTILVIAGGFLAIPFLIPPDQWEQFGHLYDRGIGAILIVLSAYLGYNLGSKKVTPNKPVTGG